MTMTTQLEYSRVTPLSAPLSTMRGLVVQGAQRGRTLGFPTANLATDAVGRIPEDGVYAGYLTVDGETYPAAISVGSNPTFTGVPEQQVEAHVLDQSMDLYGRTVVVDFVTRIRGMVAFRGVEALVDQIRDDVEVTRRLVA